MPRSIGSVQQSNISAIMGMGESEQMYSTIGEETGLSKILLEWGDRFMKNLAQTAKEEKVVATGNMLSDFEFELVNNNTGLQIKLLNYYDYPNKGVRGVKSTKNAPSSPYKFKSLYTMSPEGRSSLKRYIEEGRAKIATVKSSGTLVGLEQKKKPLIDIQVDTLIYNIKKYGIKATNYFDRAVQMTFNNEFYVSMAEAVGKDIIFTLNKF